MCPCVCPCVCLDFPGVAGLTRAQLGLISGENGSCMIERKEKREIIERGEERKRTVGLCESECVCGGGEIDETQHEGRNSGISGGCK